MKYIYIAKLTCDTIHKTIKEKELTYKDVAKMANSSPSAICRICNGNLKKISVELAQRLENALGIAINNALDDASDMLKKIEELENENKTLKGMLGVENNSEKDTKDELGGSFFVDFENIGNPGLKCLIEQIKSSKIDMVVIFYSENNKSIDFDTMKGLMNLNTKIELIKANVGGKNALDFQLSSYLGYLVGKKNNSSYNIVSNDKGFDYVVSFWKENNVKIKRLGFDLKQDSNSTKDKSQPSTSTLSEDELKGVLPNDDTLKVVLDAFNKYKTKKEINVQIQKHCHNNNKASKIYNKLKPLFEKYNKS